MLNAKQIPVLLVCASVLIACGGGANSGADAGATDTSAADLPVPDAVPDGPDTGCGAAFSFGTFADTYSGQEGGLRRIFGELERRGVRFITSAGDTPSYERVRTVLDEELVGLQTCSAAEFPWFPAPGNHDSEVQEYMDWWAQNWAGNWTTQPALSRLAGQMPLSNFQRGPLEIQSARGPVLTADHGTMYSFDYENAHFVFINDYEQDIIDDQNAGVWDVNGAGVEDATRSQLDWLKTDLEANTKPAIFVFGHVALLYPCYNYSPPSDYYPCDGPQPPGWSEHNSNFHHAELTQLLVDYRVTAYFHGHDHVLSRMLINRDRTAAYERKYWEVANDPNGAAGDPSQWEGLQGPGRVWQIDAGRVYTPGGTYVVTTVTSTEATFQMFSYPNNDPSSTLLWDTWTVPLP